MSLHSVYDILIKWQPGAQTVGGSGLEAFTFPILSSRENADGHPWKPSE